MYKSDDWQKLEFGKSIILPYVEKKDIQYLWIRGNFNAGTNHEKLYGLIIPRFFIVDRTYVNKSLVGYLNEEEISNLDNPRNYVVPSDIFIPQMNSVYIRGGVYDDWDLDFSGDVIIQRAEEFRKTRSRTQLLYDLLPISILTLILVSFSSLMIKAAMEKWNQEYLILAFRLAIVIVIYLTFYSPVPIFSIPVINAIWSMMLPLFFISMVLLYQEIYKIYFKTINFFVITFFITTSIILFLLKLSGKFEAVTYWIVGLTFVSAMIYIIFIINKIIINRKRDYKLVVVLADSILILVNIFIVVLFLVLGKSFIDPSLSSQISGLLLSILFSIYFARKEGLRKLKMESLISKLNEIEVKSDKGQKFNISPSLDKKFAQILLFIKNNFSESISREELADTVGINPNYFSSLFNIYTGKKVNEYINEVRLKEASAVLRTQNTSILDVAFSSGFDSLSTFNRLFKKNFTCSPKEYRNKYRSPENKSSCFQN